jgi:anhydro-N-acetylmuramic acid kinase
MSGTSLDEVDLAHWFYHTKYKWFEILHSETVPYTADWLNKLKIAVSLKNAALENWTKTTRNIWVRLFLILSKTHNKKRTQFAHGHTVLHQPQKVLPCKLVTWQKYLK